MSDEIDKPTTSSTPSATSENGWFGLPSSSTGTTRRKARIHRRAASMDVNNSNLFNSLSNPTRNSSLSSGLSTLQEDNVGIGDENTSISSLQRAASSGRGRERRANRLNTKSTTGSGSGNSSSLEQKSNRQAELVEALEKANKRNLDLSQQLIDQQSAAAASKQNEVARRASLSMALHKLETQNTKLKNNQDEMFGQNSQANQSSLGQMRSANVELSKKLEEQEALNAAFIQQVVELESKAKYISSAQLQELSMLETSLDQANERNSELTHRLSTETVRQRDQIAELQHQLQLKTDYIKIIESAKISEKQNLLKHISILEADNDETVASLSRMLSEHTGVEDQLKNQIVLLNLNYSHLETKYEGLRLEKANQLGEQETRYTEAMVNLEKQRHLSQVDQERLVEEAAGKSVAIETAIKAHLAESHAAEIADAKHEAVYEKKQVEELKGQLLQQKEMYLEHISLLEASADNKVVSLSQEVTKYGDQANELKLNVSELTLKCSDLEAKFEELNKLKTQQLNEKQWLYEEATIKLEKQVHILQVDKQRYETDMEAKRENAASKSKKSISSIELLDLENRLEHEMKHVKTLETKLLDALDSHLQEKKALEADLERQAQLETSSMKSLAAEHERVLNLEKHRAMVLETKLEESERKSNERKEELFEAAIELTTYMDQETDFQEKQEKIAISVISRAQKRLFDERLKNAWRIWQKEVAIRRDHVQSVNKISRALKRMQHLELWQAWRVWQQEIQEKRFHQTRVQMCYKMIRRKQSAMLRPSYRSWKHILYQRRNAELHKIIVRQANALQAATAAAKVAEVQIATLEDENKNIATEHIAVKENLQQLQADHVDLSQVQSEYVKEQLNNSKELQSRAEELWQAQKECREVQRTNVQMESKLSASKQIVVGLQATITQQANELKTAEIAAQSVHAQMTDLIDDVKLLQEEKDDLLAQHQDISISYLQVQESHKDQKAQNDDLAAEYTAMKQELAKLQEEHVDLAQIKSNLVVEQLATSKQLQLANEKTKQAHKDLEELKFANTLLSASLKSAEEHKDRIHNIFEDQKQNLKQEMSLAVEDFGAEKSQLKLELSKLHETIAKHEDELKVNDVAANIASERLVAVTADLERAQKENEDLMASHENLKDNHKEQLFQNQSLSADLTILKQELAQLQVEHDALTQIQNDFVVERSANGKELQARAGQMWRLEKQARELQRLNTQRESELSASKAEIGQLKDEIINLTNSIVESEDAQLQATNELGEQRRIQLVSRILQRMKYIQIWRAWRDWQQDVRAQSHEHVDKLETEAQELQALTARLVQVQADMAKNQIINDQELQASASELRQLKKKYEEIAFTNSALSDSLKAAEEQQNRMTQTFQEEHATAQDIGEKLRKLEMERGKIDSELATSRQTIVALRAELSSVRSYLDNQHAEGEDREKEHQQLVEQMQALQAEFEKCSTEKALVEAHYVDLQHQFTARGEHIYRKEEEAAQANEKLAKAEIEHEKWANALLEASAVSQDLLVSAESQVNIVRSAGAVQLQAAHEKHKNAILSRMLKRIQSIKVWRAWYCWNQHVATHTYLQQDDKARKLHNDNLALQKQLATVKSRQYGIDQRRVLTRVVRKLQSLNIWYSWRRWEQEIHKHAKIDMENQITNLNCKIEAGDNRLRTTKLSLSQQRDLVTFAHHTTKQQLATTQTQLRAAEETVKTLQLALMKIQGKYAQERRVQVLSRVLRLDSLDIAQAWKRWQKEILREKEADTELMEENLHALHELLQAQSNQLIKLTADQTGLSSSHIKLSSEYEAVQTALNHLHQEHDILSVKYNKLLVQHERLNAEHKDLSEHHSRSDDLQQEHASIYMKYNTLRAQHRHLNIEKMQLQFQLTTIEDHILSQGGTVETANLRKYISDVEKQASVTPYDPDEFNTSSYNSPNPSPRKRDDNADFYEKFPHLWQQSPPH